VFEGDGTVVYLFTTHEYDVVSKGHHWLWIMFIALENECLLILFEQLAKPVL